MSPAILWRRDTQLWALAHLRPTVICAGHGGAVIRACPWELAVLGISDALAEELELMAAEVTK